LLLALLRLLPSGARVSGKNMAKNKNILKHLSSVGLRARTKIT